MEETRRIAREETHWKTRDALKDRNWIGRYEEDWQIAVTLERAQTSISTSQLNSTTTRSIPSTPTQPSPTESNRHLPKQYAPNISTCPYRLCPPLPTQHTPYRLNTIPIGSNRPLRPQYPLLTQHAPCRHNSSRTDSTLYPPANHKRLEDKRCTERQETNWEIKMLWKITD